MNLDRKGKIQLIKAFSRAVLSNEARDFKITHELDHRVDENSVVRPVLTGIKRVSFTLVRSSSAWLDTIKDQKAREMEAGTGDRSLV